MHADLLGVILSEVDVHGLLELLGRHVARVFERVAARARFHPSRLRLSLDNLHHRLLRLRISLKQQLLYIFKLGSRLLGNIKGVVIAVEVALQV